MRLTEYKVLNILTITKFQSLEILPFRYRFLDKKLLSHNWHLQIFFVALQTGRWMNERLNHALHCLRNFDLASETAKVYSICLFANYRISLRFYPYHAFLLYGYNFWYQEWGSSQCMSFPTSRLSITEACSWKAFNSHINETLDSRML